MKKSTRIILWTSGIIVGLILIILGTLTAILYNKKEDIKEALLHKANEQLESQLSVKDISVGFISNFPNITIALKGVRLEKTIPSDSAFISLNKIECIVSVPQLIIGNISVHRLHLSDGYVQMNKDSLGIKDFAIVKPKKNKSAAPKQKLNIDINRIDFRNVSFHLHDEYRPKDIHLTLKRVQAELHIDSLGADANLNGTVFSHGLTFKDKTFLEKKETTCDLNIKLHSETRTLEVTHSSVKVSNHDLQVSMTIDFNNDRMMKLRIQHPNANPNAMLDLLPMKFRDPIKDFQFQGELGFVVEINTSLSPGKKPFVNVKFNSKNLGLIRKGRTNKLHDIVLDGTLSVRPIDNKLVPSVAFHTFKGKINNQDFTVKALIKNFNNPWLDLKLYSPIDLTHMAEWFHIQKIEEASGKAIFDLSYKGYFAYLIGESNIIPEIKGSITLDQVYMKLEKIIFPFTDLTGKIRFENQFAHLDSFYVKSGRSNLTMKASMENLLPALLSTRSTFHLNGEFNSDSLVVDDFIHPAHKAKQTANHGNKQQVKKIVQAYFPSQTIIHLKGNIGTLKNERFIVKGVALEFNLDNHIVDFTCEGNTSLGSVKTKVKVDGSNLNAIKVTLNSKIRNIDVSKFLYSFKNFHQTLITSDVLKGKFTGNINLTCSVNKNLQVNNRSIRGTITFEIKDGELNNFEPFLKATNTLTKGRDLEHVTFQDIHSKISVGNERVMLDRTAIASSAGLLYVEGTADFNNYINFLVTIPVKTIIKKYQPKPEELSNDAQAGPSVIIRVEGPPDKVKVKIEKATVKK